MVKRLRHRPFTAVTRVRFSVESPKRYAVAVAAAFLKESVRICCSDLRVHLKRRNPVTIAGRTHLYPSRTQPLSSPAPMILGGRLPGKVGRCRFSEKQAVSACFFRAQNLRWCWKDKIGVRQDMGSLQSSIE